jgi:tRNA dimethylallyltransferase
MAAESDAMTSFSLPSNAILLAGPTAVGKSALALELASELGGEIISVDSMQVYRGLDIGTAKPSAQDRARIPHYLLDVVDVTEPFDAAWFVRLARQAIADVESRGRLPILCGGTGLYFKALLEGLGQAPPADPVLRAQLESAPLPELLRELAQLDPATFERIDQKNPRRVIRAVEVIRLSGKPFSAQRAKWRRNPHEKPDVPVFLGLTREPGDLRRRIDERVEKMFQAGLVAETESMLERGLAQNPVALQALGYRQITQYLRGECSLPQVIDLIKIRTRHFAKRQMTWFKRQTYCHWIQLGTDGASDFARVSRCVKEKSDALRSVHQAAIYEGQKSA